MVRRIYSEVYSRKLETYKRRQTNKKRLARNMKNKWRLRRMRENARAQAWLDGIR